MDNGNDGSALAPSMPEAAAHGLTWDTRGPDPEMRPDHQDAELMHDGDHVAGVSLCARLWRDPNGQSGGERFAKIDTYGKDRGSLQEQYPTLADGMSAAESWAVDRGFTLHLQDKSTRAFLDSQVAPTQFFQTPKIEQYAEASESFYARLSEIADRRGAEIERRGMDFDLER